MTAARAGLYIAVGCVTYLAALVAMTPAAWISHIVERASRQVLVLRDPAGTAWAGSGRLFARQRGGGLLDLGALRWKATPAHLLTGKLVADVRLGSGPTSLRLELSPTSMTVRGLDLEFPAKILSTLVPGLQALGPEGKLRVRSDDLRFGGDWVLGLADIEWRDVRLANAQGIALGSHVAHIRGGGNKMDIELASIEGPLRLSGGGTWVAANGLTVAGVAEPVADREAALAPFLKSVCSEYRDARCLFHLKQ
jgi:general secretion pathway protein N